MEICSSNEIIYFDRKSNEIPKHSGFIFLIGWRWLINPSKYTIVIHDSYLPKYRGFAPVVNSLINGERYLGVTALFASDEYDKGKIIYQNKIYIEYPLKVYDALELVSEQYVIIIIKILNDIEKNIPIISFNQDESQSSYSVWRDEVDYQIDWNQNSQKISRIIDALGFPFGGARSTINGCKCIIHESNIIDDVNIESRSDNIGKVLFIKDKFPIVICGSGLLRIQKIVDSNGNSLLPLFKFRSRFC